MHLLNKIYKHLPGARIEGERVAALLGVEPWLGPDVLEGRLKDRCRSPRVLHLATHGFFLEDQHRELRSLIRSHWILGEPFSLESGLRLIGLPENPLLRSGLILAGVNARHAGRAAPPEAEDGLLTAEDVSGMDLAATELVVLSACDTGRGEVRTGEGVFGLQRAFVLAGARTLVMSLWEADDLATAILMERFYGNLLRRRLGRAEALRDAQRHTRDLAVGAIRGDWLSDAMIARLAAGDPDAEEYYHDLAARPDDYRPFEHPYYWGAFVCLGDPAPISQEERAGGL